MPGVGVVARVDQVSVEPCREIVDVDPSGGAFSSGGSSGFCRRKEWQRKGASDEEDEDLEGENGNYEP